MHSTVLFAMKPCITSGERRSHQARPRLRFWQCQPAKVTDAKPRKLSPAMPLERRRRLRLPCWFFASPSRIDRRTKIASSPLHGRELYRLALQVRPSTQAGAMDDFLKLFADYGGILVILPTQPFLTVAPEHLVPEDKQSDSVFC
jgi:hypothetical protein